jgi:hypothetical protein
VLVARQGDDGAASITGGRGVAGGAGEVGRWRRISRGGARAQGSERDRKTAGEAMGDGRGGGDRLWLRPVHK